LHPKIHAGILALRENEDHVAQMKDSGMSYIDMVVVNLYPFEETVSKEGTTFETAIENIDIGGPSMLRSAAKNFQSVAVVSNTEQYGQVLDELEQNDGEISRETLLLFAIEVFKRTAEYDGAIHAYLSSRGLGTGNREQGTVGRSNDSQFSDTYVLNGTKVWDLRYGENPHQQAAFYKDNSFSGTGVADLEQLQGKQLSFNNILDAGSALNIAGEFDEPAVAIIKHNNPCGAAEAQELDGAFLAALDCDRLSAFGSIIAFNRLVNGQVAELVLKELSFLECVIAPEFHEDALRIFESKQNLRVLSMAGEEMKIVPEKDVKKVQGGFLVQDADTKRILQEDLNFVTENKPSKDIVESLLFGWKVVKHVKSNAILLCDGKKTIGIGAGQMSRVDSVITAVRKAGDKAKGSIMASDAFFPMADSIDRAHEAGITAIIQPGGSIRDKEVIAACDKYGIAMAFTGVRHFRH
jgi:phosphoribosylaminoimidazolecarboxamide formyltransferase / IMP cyclohydrolase